ncbi:LysM peptidoglycan-binding domain-containing protein [Flavimaricola marinus]|uniref:LysM domain/BON superfamily protein n=1 Tax=Flavimaricola marinus TaxID=1819565 RepID=A0A238L9X4_9RHOB|nr:LysM peptidoglycan-binding domain-containing protein [Flavimaricola marinus]SMY06517.1 LysM domain/BON superfamily protein [Flavimaricola marinus]
MIRIVVGLFVFSVILCAWIVIDPSGGDKQPDAVAGAAPAVDRLGAGVEVTREQPAQVETFQPALRSVTRVMAPSSTLRTGEETLDQTTAGILAGLGLDTGVPAPAPTDEMGQMTSGILSSIRAVTGGTPAPAEPSALSELVIGALRAGETDATIDTLVNEAASAGTVAVPNILVTADGRVDTSVLLASIVTQARVASGQPAPAVPDVPVDGAGVEVRVVQTSTDAQQFRFYTVNSGDSLGAIAIKFYGDAAFYGRIFDANRSTLSSPDRIRVGQRLVIPEL